jgi:hypothetical protein
MLTYLSALFSGTTEPFWPHLILISGSVLAGIAVGAGILLESNEYSTSVHRLANWLVIVGVVIESVCTVCLFVFDEGISGAQQSKIIALETKHLDRSKILEPWSKNLSRSLARLSIFRYSLTQNR